MADGQTISKQARRIAFFAEDARVFPEELTAFISRLSTLGHRVRCFAPSWSDQVAKLATASGAETDSYPVDIDENWALMPKRALRKKVADSVNGWSPDIVVALGPRSALRILPTARTGNCKRIAILDRFALEDSAPEIVEPGRELAADDVAQLAANADTIFCHANRDSDDLAAAISTSSTKTCPRVETLPGYGVNTTSLTLQPLPSIENGISFLMTAPLDHWKGVMDFSAAASLVTGRNDQAKFRLQGAAGRSPDAIPYKEILSPGRIEPVETTVGLAQAIANAHVVVVSSFHDGMPRELLAALALGRPVICADFAGSREAIDERTNGIIYERGNPNALANACESIMRRPELLAAMGRASRQKAERRFSEDAVLRSYCDIMGVIA